MKILYEDKYLLVCEKPVGVESQVSSSGTENMIDLLSQYRAQRGEEPYVGLVHRLDRVVGGLVVFARGREYAAALSELVGGCGMEKEYIAVVEGRAEGGALTDWLYKDSKKGKAFVVSERPGAKKSELEYTPLAFFETERGNRTLVKIVQSIVFYVRLFSNLYILWPQFQKDVLFPYQLLQHLIEKDVNS